MKGRLFTGRIYEHRKIKHHYPDVLLVCVMRWAPKRIDLKKSKILHLQALSPSANLLTRYKKKMQKKMSLREKEAIWKNFVTDYVTQIQKDSKAQDERFFIRSLLAKGTKITLLCHEGINEDCHRRILPDLLLTEKELKDGVYRGEVSFEETIQMKLDL